MTPKPLYRLAGIDFQATSPDRLVLRNAGNLFYHKHNPHRLTSWQEESDGTVRLYAHDRHGWHPTAVTITKDPA